MLRLTITLSIVAAIIAQRADAAPANCVDVRAYGATPDNSADDDRVGIQAAITVALATGGPHAICLPGGTYDIKSKASGSNASFDLGGAANLAIYGDGTGTVVKMNMNAGGLTWYLFQINNGAQQIELHDLTLDGSAVTSSGVTRLVQIGTGESTVTSTVRMAGVTLRNSPGDAIQIFASTSSVTVKGVSLSGCRFSTNTGRGIAVYGGVQGVQITTSYFDNNTGFDFATSYNQMPLPTVSLDGLMLANNVVTRSAAASPVSMQLLGLDTTPHKHASVTGNLFLNGRVLVRGFDDVTFAGNVVSGGTGATSDPELLIEGQADNPVVEANQLIRSSTTSANVLDLTHISGVAPKRAVIRGNVVVQASANTPVYIYSVTNVVFDSNYVAYNNATTGLIGVAFRAVNNAMDQIQISDNVITSSGGALLSGIYFLRGTTTLDIKHIVITGNVINGATTGVTFAGGTFSTIPIIGDNLFQVTTDISGLTSSIVPAVALGGNTGGVVQLMGPVASGSSPNIAAPIGSLFYNRSGTPTLWVKESGTGTTGWVSK